MNSESETPNDHGSSVNPYVPPAAGQPITPVGVQDQSSGHQRGILCIIIAASLLTGLDAAVFQLGFLVVFAPPILFFVITFWSFLDGTRKGSLSLSRRIGVGLLLGLFAAPCFEAIFMTTCTPIVNAAGPFWTIHGQVNPTLFQRSLFFLATAILLAALSLSLHWLFAWVLQRRKSTPPNSVNGIDDADVDHSG